MELALTLFSSFLITWGIGLIPPLLLRFVIFKKQLGKTFSIILVAILLLINLVIFITLSLATTGESGRHTVLGLVAVISYFILRAKNSKQIKPDDAGLQDNFEKTNIAMDVKAIGRKSSKKLFKVPKPIMVFLVISLTFGGLFYWYELRPAKIRQECSWVKHTTEVIPAKPAMTEEELKAEGITKDCSGKRAKSSGQVTGIYESIFDEDKDTCERKNRQVVDGYKTDRPAVPAKDWYSKASEKQYAFCLHDKGL